jgi:uncharacterized glyoxalase superfamily protein PhnB
MSFLSLAPILQTDDMARSVRFYTEVLGFACGMQTADYSNLHRDKVRIMLASHDVAESGGPPRFTGQLYIGLDTPEEVDAEWRRIKDKATIIYPVDDQSYGAREFGIRDDSGYHIAIGAPSGKS